MVISLLRQLRLVGFEAPTAARKLGPSSGAWLVTYVMAAGSVLALVAWQLIEHSDDLMQIAMDYVLPADWHFAARTLFHRFFAQQEQLVITNAVVVAALLAVQITLF